MYLDFLMRWSFLGSIDQLFEVSKRSPPPSAARTPPPQAWGRREEGRSCWAMMWGKVVGEVGTDGAVAGAVAGAVDGSMVWARL